MNLFFCCLLIVLAFVNDVANADANGIFVSTNGDLQLNSYGTAVSTSNQVNIIGSSGTIVSDVLGQTQSNHAQWRQLRHLQMFNYPSRLTQQFNTLNTIVSPVYANAFTVGTDRYLITSDTPSSVWKWNSTTEQFYGFANISLSATGAQLLGWVTMTISGTTYLVPKYCNIFTTGSNSIYKISGGQIVASQSNFLPLIKDAGYMYIPGALVNGTVVEHWLWVSYTNTLGSVGWKLFAANSTGLFVDTGKSGTKSIDWVTPFSGNGNYYFGLYSSDGFQASFYQFNNNAANFSVSWTSSLALTPSSPVTVEWVTGFSISGTLYLMMANSGTISNNSYLLKWTGTTWEYVPRQKNYPLGKFVTSFQIDSNTYMYLGSYTSVAGTLYKWNSDVLDFDPMVTTTDNTFEVFTSNGYYYAVGYTTSPSMFNVYRLLDV